MRHTEFWARMDEALGSGYSRSWAESVVMGELGGQTAVDALASGYSPKEVWAAVWRTLELPATKR